jgi:hypothetical protein
VTYTSVHTLTRPRQQCGASHHPQAYKHCAPQYTALVSRWDKCVSVDGDYKAVRCVPSAATYHSAIKVRVKSLAVALCLLCCFMKLHGARTGFIRPITNSYHLTQTAMSHSLPRHTDCHVTHRTNTHNHHTSTQ